MIPLDYITAWRTHAPWSLQSQVEQDLIICRALVELFSHPFMHERLAFYRGTPLFKLHLPPARYSEDIDLVQMQSGPIGPIMDAVQEKFNPWLGTPKRKQSEGRVILIWRVKSVEDLPLRLKVEINSLLEFVENGGLLVTDGRTPLAESLGLGFEERKVTVREVKDLTVPSRNIRWNPAVQINPAYSSGAIVNCQSSVKGIPLAMTQKLGRGRFLYLSAPFDP